MSAKSVTGAIKDAILAGEFMPGERLVEAQLTERFGASRFTVRVALQDLSGEGLVEIQRNRGAQVRKISLAETIEITQVRMVLEGLVAAQAAERATAGQTAELDGIAGQMRQAVADGEFRRYSDLNQRLHAMIRDIAGHTTADRLIGTLRAQLARHQFMLSLLPGRPQTSLPEHERIVAAIRAHDPAEAEAAMRAHIASVISVLKSLDD
ncbi:GntR family transcriptional regulator [Actinoplanes couchii]|uniref:GntR family transcriptional regulator n=1 Tax=Actinoplanes couchii TaxID=403638 RepID=A0ABQ3XFS0_9ACTN|nr:GntR family transcriptional regulator [Actinoplanes couchii]MDR6321726.1 DNA-binding GntR family transcriptional regulator [Actinoplanes couchii]GID57318.1 GntR family transcriptional regulator [Actinoplanes couchii]